MLRMHFQRLIYGYVIQHSGDLFFQLVSYVVFHMSRIQYNIKCFVFVLLVAYSFKKWFNFPIKKILVYLFSQIIFKYSNCYYFWQLNSYSYLLLNKTYKEAFSHPPNVSNKKFYQFYHKNEVAMNSEGGYFWRKMIGSEASHIHPRIVHQIMGSEEWQ